MFANLDGWGVDTNFEIVQRIAQQQSSEVLVTFKDQFFIRFADGEQEAGERVFGHSDWRSVDQLPTPDKKPFLLSLYRQCLHDAGFPHVLTFEMIDEGGHSLYLFFGTTNEVAVQKFKDGLWEVDGVTGQRFRDPRDPNQMSFDILQPDFTPLAKSIIELLETREHSMAELCRYALLETIYKDTHVKPVVDSLIGERKVEVARTGRSYEDRVLRLAPTSLFDPRGDAIPHVNTSGEMWDTSADAPTASTFTTQGSPIAGWNGRCHSADQMGQSASTQFRPRRSRPSVPQRLACGPSGGHRRGREAGASRMQTWRATALGMSRVTPTCSWT